MSAPSDSVSFAVVIPMYNEEVGAELCVRAVAHVLEAMGNRSALIAINDGSRDGTLDILRALAHGVPKLSIVDHGRNQGYGAALKTGAREAARLGYDYVLFMDSDLTNDPAYLPAFVALMQQGFDVIKASRYIPGGGADGIPAWRVAFSVLGNRVARLLFRLPLRDCTNGYRALRTAILTRMELQERGFPIIMEELYHARWLAKRFAEVPIRLTSRKAGQRVSSFSYNYRTLYSYLKYPVLSFLNIRPRSLHSQRDTI
jgi:dolichol-phosphate mannosyltransferase